MYSSFSVNLALRNQIPALLFQPKHSTAMRNFLLFCLFGLTVALHLQASEISPRDTIFKKNGEIFRVKILRQVGDTVFYSPYGSQEEKFFLTAELSKLSYDSGQLVLFNEASKSFAKPAVIAVPKDEVATYGEGLMDGGLYYRPRGLLGLGAALFLLSFIGLAVVAVISLVKPELGMVPFQDLRLRTGRDYTGKTIDRKKLNHLFKSPQYREGYRKAAHRWKAGRVWLGYLLGFAGLVLLYLIAVAVLLLIFI
jgi:hypothetical protein